jgi:hypothetical protein
MVPMPVGLEVTTSIGLKPMPLEVGWTNQGSSQPISRSNDEPMLNSQNVLVPEPRAPGPVVAGVGRCSRPRPSLGTGGHVHAEEPNRAEGEDDHQDREDQ